MSLIISKSPMRISLFGGTTDYTSFYERYGSIIIGTTIDKFVYSTIRFIPRILKDYSIIKYSIIEHIHDLNKIKNPLIRETLKYYGIVDRFELCFDSDVPSRTGLGGSSACCASLATSICNLLSIDYTSQKICNDIIKIEREILNEPGGIQDQLWTCYGGFQCITIEKNGEYYMHDIFRSMDMRKHFEDSLLLIYTQQRRNVINSLTILDDKFKLRILDIAKNACVAFKKENISLIGKLLYDSWIEKKHMSPSISNDHIDSIISDVMYMGGYGAKLLGNGSGGFVLAVCNKISKARIKEKYSDSILDFAFYNEGALSLQL